MKKKGISLYLIAIFADWFCKLGYVAEFNGGMAILEIFVFVQECLREAF